MYFKSHISVTNRFVLSVTYFKSCSRVLPALIFFMARHRPKKSGCYVLHIRSQGSSGFSKPSFPAQTPVQNRMRGRYWEWDTGRGAGTTGGNWLRQRVLRIVSETGRSSCLSHHAGLHNCSAPSARTTNYTNVIRHRTQYVCINKPPRPRSGNYCTCFLNRTKISVVMKLCT